MCQISTEEEHAKAWLQTKLTEAQEGLRRSCSEHREHYERRRDVLSRLVSSVNVSAKVTEDQKTEINIALTDLFELSPGRERRFRTRDLARYINTCDGS